MAGFLAPWLTDVGALVGLVTGIVAVLRAFSEGRPYSYVEPDTLLDGLLKLYVVNAGGRSIVVTYSYVRPRERWYLAPNAAALTGKGRQQSLYGKKESLPDDWHNQNVIIEAGKRHEFFLGLRERDSKPTWCCVVTCWQPLGGLPMSRPPLFVYKSGKQVERLFVARKGRQDT
jgi:hypothetical protein